MEEITFFAKTNFRNQNVKFGIKSSDRQRHIYVIGKTGMGKTTLLENIVMQDIANGHGVAYIDPHGDTAEKLIKAIPSHRINDVVYFNPADTENPIAFNILESVNGGEDKNRVASGMMGVFKKIWPDVWSARMEYILSNTILALLDYPGSTMLGVNRMMNDKKYRQRVYEKIQDPIVKTFWLDEFEAWDDKFRKEAVAAIQNKVGQFLSSFLIRNIVGQAKSTINMRDIMDNKKILIVNLSKGRIGEDAMRLLGGMIVTKIQLAAMERVDIPEEERKNFYLTVDEFQNFVTESFANILSEARKYRLNLLVAHQYINQLVVDSNSVVRDAIFGNVGTIISFRVGAEDAEFLEKEFEPVFTANDIVNLPKYNIYLKLMIDGIAGNAFSATALSPIDIGGTQENAEKVIRISRERYTVKREEIEEKISRWTGMIINKENSKPTSLQKVNPAFETENRNHLHGLNERPVERFSIRSESKSMIGDNKIDEDFEAVESRKIREEKFGESVSALGNQSKKSDLAEDLKNSDIVLNKQNESSNFEVKEKSAFLNNDNLKESAQNSEINSKSPDEISYPILEDKNEKKGFVEKVDNVDNVDNNERKFYEAECDTCGVVIQIPFKPDGERPTFCKDCLKDYQRAIARIKNEENENKLRQANAGRRFSTGKNNLQENRPYPSISGKIETKQRVYKSKEKPLSLNQTKFIAPKRIGDMDAGRELSKLKEILAKNNNPTK